MHVQNQLCEHTEQICALRISTLSGGLSSTKKSGSKGLLFRHAVRAIGVRLPGEIDARGERLSCAHSA